MLSFILQLDAGGTFLYQTGVQVRQILAPYNVHALVYMQQGVFIKQVLKNSEGDSAGSGLFNRFMVNFGQEVRFLCVLQNLSLLRAHTTLIVFPALFVLLSSRRSLLRVGTEHTAEFRCVHDGSHREGWGCNLQGGHVHSPAPR